MIKEFSDAFKSLVRSLSIRPLPTLAAILILCTGYIGIRSYRTLENMVVTPEEEAARFEAQLNSAALVNSSIEKLRSDLGAENVVIRQFHNGRHDLTGIPFTETSATYYTSTFEDNGDEAVSSMNTSLKKIWGGRIDKPECIVLYGPVDASTGKYFRSYKLAKMIQCPLTNLLKYPVGTITVGFSESDTKLKDDVLLEKTSYIAKRITGYLVNGY